MTTVIVSVGEIQRRMMELVEKFNKHSEDAKVMINWRYWLTNAVFMEKHRNEYFIVSKDGLILHIIDNTEYNAGVTVKIDSLHSSSCYCGE